jgi:Protein of unknown function (DUF1573)
MRVSAHKTLIWVFLGALVSCQHYKPSVLTVVPDKELQLGTIRLQDTAKCVFKLKNTSEIPLEILGIEPSCGCTTTALTQKKIAFGEAVTLEVFFTPEEQGAFKKTIVIKANTEPPFTVLSLAGNVN